MRCASPLTDEFARWMASRGSGAAGDETSRAEADRPGAATGERTAPPELVMIPWGPGSAESESAPQVEIPGDFGEFELEYAALRRSAGVMEMSNRAVLRLSGADRLDFLGRMLTQDVRAIAPGEVRASFLLNRKGRIEGDLVLVELGGETLIDLDVHQAEAVRGALEAFIIADDVQLKSMSDSAHRIALHGRRAEALLAAAVTGTMPPLSEGRATRIVLAGAETIVWRRDLIGEPGFELLVPRGAAAAVWRRLVDASVEVGDRSRFARPVGWFAYNVARVEARTPIFNIDFGTTSLPHESGVLHDRVSFRKGCYLGQEIVARMESLGKPKQMLIAMTPAADAASPYPLPVSGALVMKEGEEAGEPVGMVTSSAISPLAGGVPVMLAVVRTQYAEPGTHLTAWGEGKPLRCVVEAMRKAPMPEVRL